MATKRKSSTRRQASSGRSARRRSAAARVKRRAGAKRAATKPAKRRAGAKRSVAGTKKKKKAVKKKTAPKKTARKKAARKKAAPKKAARKKTARKKTARKKAAPKKTVRKKVASKKAMPKKAAKKKTAKKAVRKAAAKATKKVANKTEQQTVKTKKQPAPAKAARPAKAAPVKTAKSVRPAKAAKSRELRPEPVVRPLGVLPPESRVRVRRSQQVDGPRVAFPDRTSHDRPTTTASQGAERLSDQDLKVFEERLVAERQKILRDMGHLETTVLKVNQRDSAGDLSGYSFHMADAGTDAMEREKAFRFASAEGRLLLEINDALRRIYNGEYGMCESCGQPIARARLEAIPHARLCVPCKSKEERAGRGAQ